MSKKITSEDKGTVDYRMPDSRGDVLACIKWLAWLNSGAWIDEDKSHYKVIYPGDLRHVYTSMSIYTRHSKKKLDDKDKRYEVRPLGSAQGDLIILPEAKKIFLKIMDDETGAFLFLRAAELAPTKTDIRIYLPYIAGDPPESWAKLKKRSTYRETDGGTKDAQVDLSNDISQYLNRTIG